MVEQFGNKVLRIIPEKFIDFPVVLYSALTHPLSLENISTNHVAYKIKTTAPKSYLVRPSSGVIAPGEVAEVHIILQPLQSMDQISTSDRFLVQSTTVVNGKPLPRDLWQSLEKSQIDEHRLSVVFNNQDGETNSNSVPNRSTEGLNTICNDLSDQRMTANNSNTTNIHSQYDQKDLKAKYDELVQYCIALEKQSSDLKTDNILLREQLEKMGSSANGSSATAAHYYQGFEFWHIIAMIFVAIIALKLINYF